MTVLASGVTKLRLDAVMVAALMSLPVDVMENKPLALPVIAPPPLNAPWIAETAPLLDRKFTVVEADAVPVPVRVIPTGAFNLRVPLALLSSPALSTDATLSVRSPPEATDVPEPIIWMAPVDPEADASSTTAPPLKL